MNQNIQKSDSELITEILNGETELFRILVDRYKNTVAGIVMNMVQSKDKAEDIGQEVFVRLYRSLKKFKGDSSLGTYIGRIAINLSLNELKREQKMQQRFKSGYEGIEIESSGNMASDIENVELLEMALQSLKPQYRSIIVLRHIEGYSTKETSEIVQLPQGTVLSRLSRGMEKMKKALLKLGYESD